MKETPKRAPSRDEINAMRRIWDDWKLHYYQLLYFQNPPLTNADGYPFDVKKTDRDFLGLVIVPPKAPEFEFAVYAAKDDVEQESMDREVLSKIVLIQEAIKQGLKKQNRYACCGLAHQVSCVCNYKSDCPIHGIQCNGSHD